MKRRIAASLLLAGIGQAVLAQNNFEEDFDTPGKPWEELAAQLPAPPQQAKLLPFYVSPTATHQFAIDASSLTVDSDGVIRYTLVSTNSAGVKNISYEGIRCRTLEKKLYAFGRNDGSWGRSRRDAWEPISGNAANRQHAALAQDFFCENGLVAGNTQQIITRMKKR